AEDLDPTLNTLYVPDYSGVHPVNRLLCVGNNLLAFPSYLLAFKPAMDSHSAGEEQRLTNIGTDRHI
ncbi:hypothetical protein JYU34_005478, partial [Plutella xylostella]